jgi:hypothetical protein
MNNNPLSPWGPDAIIGNMRIRAPSATCARAPPAVVVGPLHSRRQPCCHRFLSPHAALHDGANGGRAVSRVITKTRLHPGREPLHGVAVLPCQPVLHRNPLSSSLLLLQLPPLFLLYGTKTSSSSTTTSLPPFSALLSSLASSLSTSSSTSTMCAKPTAMCVR